MVLCDNLFQYKTTIFWNMQENYEKINAPAAILCCFFADRASIFRFRAYFSRLSLLISPPGLN